jgi:Zn-dependent peptidase ImmA (M78 family)
VALLSTAYIHEAARRLVQYCQSRDPFHIARSIGVKVRFENGFTALKGMYTVIESKRYMFINANLRRRVQAVVCAHELGHDALHRAFAVNNALKEFMLYDMATRPEYEANVFAGELLLDDNDVYSLIKDGCDLPNIAGELDTDYNLLLIKMNEMTKKGYDLRLPFLPDTRFLGKTRDGDFDTDDF